ncbi:MAG: hypothetical protein H7222_07155 [Methylotenera sp.]|nr:hypothetical protein [Oligoflexia bacterium]
MKKSLIVTLTLAAALISATWIPGANASEPVGFLCQAKCEIIQDKTDSSGQSDFTPVRFSKLITSMYTFDRDEAESFQQLRDKCSVAGGQLAAKTLASACEEAIYTPYVDQLVNFN